MVKIRLEALLCILVVFVIIVTVFLYLPIKVEYGIKAIEEHLPVERTQLNAVQRGAEARETQYGANNHFTFNNNLAQYSSYVIIDTKNGSTTHTIEGIVQFKYKYISELVYGGQENFLCVVKLTNIKDSESKEEIIVLQATKEVKFNWNYCKKYVFSLDPSSFKSVAKDASNFDVENLVVAIIWKRDFNTELDKAGFYDKLDSLSFKPLIVLPYSLISFQKPTVFRPVEPRPATVGLCVNYVYMVPSQLLNWTDMHWQFGMNEIMLYDGLQSKELTKVLKTKYGDDKRISVMNYEIGREELCGDGHLFKQCKNTTCVDAKVREILKASCVEFYETELKERIEWKWKHEQLSSNDCYIQMSKRHEFVAYYDLDEFILPRTLESLKHFYEVKRFDTCTDHSSICSSKPLTNSFPTNRREGSYLYNYLHDMIERHRNGRDIDKFASIEFPHSLMLIPSDSEKKLMRDLGDVIERIERNETSFPFKIILNEPPVEKGHTFVINETDVDFIKYLHKAYTTLIPCVYSGYLKNISNIDKSLIRYLYYLTEHLEREPKAINYYKNIGAVYHHNAMHKEPGTWTITADALNGHTSPHFREDAAAFFKSAYTGSIRKLFIDFEWMFYLLKNHTSFCQAA